MDHAVTSLFTLGQGTDPNWCFTNHGSYGSVPKPVARAQQELLERVEHNPDLWFRKESSVLFERAIAEAAEFVGVQAKDMTFVMNATEGVNCVLSSIEREGLLGPGSGILMLSLAYGAVKNNVVDVSKRTKTPVTELPIPVPLDSMEQLLALFSTCLSKSPQIKVAVLDHITSKTALMLPIEKLIRICHEHNVRVVVDGAHSIGQIPGLDLSQMNADYYVSNFHKWAFAPKGTAFLYCHPQHQSSLYPPLVSWNAFDADWRKRFEQQGTRDLTGFVAVGAALKFVKEVGLEKAHAYRRNLRDAAIADLVSMWWGPRALVQDMLVAPFDMLAPCMAVIKTPIKDEFVPNTGCSIGQDSLLVSQIFEELLKQKILLPVMSFQGYIYCRISVQIYNTRQDFQRIGQAILGFATCPKF